MATKAITETQFFPNGESCTVTLRPRAQKTFAKRYKHDSRVTTALSELLKELQAGLAPHPKYNLHRLKGTFEGVPGWWDAHLKGQAVIMRFRVDQAAHEIIIGAIGSHQEVLSETAPSEFDFLLP